MTDLERLESNRTTLEDEGYFGLRIVEGRGICGLYKFIFTVGLCEGIYTDGINSWEGRWCFEHAHIQDALLALILWDGKEDPKGRWLKYKGKKGEYHREPEQHID